MGAAIAAKASSRDMSAGTDSGHPQVRTRNNVPGLTRFSSTTVSPSVYEPLGFQRG